MASFVELVLTGITSGLVVGLAALALTLVFGIARFANAATGDMMTVGAYAAVVSMAASGSFTLGVLAGAAAGIVVALLAHLLVFRRLAARAPVTSLLASIGVAFLIRAVIGVAFGHQQKVFGLPVVRPWRIFDVRVQPIDLAVVVAAAATLLVVFLILYATPIGRRMRAVADDRSLARVSGISPDRVMVTMWALAGGVCAVAGVMLGAKTVVSPEMGWDMLLPAFAATILGGIGHPVGAVVAGVLLGVVQEIATPFVGFTYKIALAFFVLLLVLLVRPAGLFGHSEGAR
jgi:branched-chain amino acid transport system permease protein